MSLCVHATPRRGVAVSRACLPAPFQPLPAAQTTPRCHLPLPFRSDPTTPSACCVCSGPSGALRRLHAQWRGLARRAWPAVAFKVCPLRAAPSARRLAAALLSLVTHAEHLLCTRWSVWGSDASVCAMAWPGVACLARSSLQGVPAARQPPPLCPARHLAAALHPLVTHAKRLLCTQWPIWGSDASAFTIAGPDVSWWARSGPPRVPASHQTPPPLCPARHLAAPRCSLCARALRRLYMWWANGGPNASACTMAGPGVTWLTRSGPPRVPLARQTPPPVHSVAPRCALVLPVCARPAPTVHVAGYRGAPCVSLHNSRGPHASACTIAEAGVVRLAPEAAPTAYPSTLPLPNEMTFGTHLSTIITQLGINDSVTQWRDTCSKCYH